MMQKMPVEIVAVPLPFHNTSDGLLNVFFYDVGLDVRLTTRLNHGDLLLNTDDSPVAALVHKPEVCFGDGAREEFF